MSEIAHRLGHQRYYTRPTSKRRILPSDNSSSEATISTRFLFCDPKISGLVLEQGSRIKSGSFEAPPPTAVPCSNSEVTAGPTTRHVRLGVRLLPNNGVVFTHPLGRGVGLLEKRACWLWRLLTTALTTINLA